jgi:Protein of unknown function DUF86
MAAKTPRLYLEHIRDAIGLIEQYVRGRQRPDLDRDPMLRQATWRNIEIISEASRRVPEAMKARHPEVPWRHRCHRQHPSARIPNGQPRHHLADRDRGRPTARRGARLAPGRSAA